MTYSYANMPLPFFVYYQFVTFRLGDPGQAWSI